MVKKDKRLLKGRYLLWLYKTTKEALDRVDRKFTQLEIDKVILKELIRSDKGKRIKKHIREFQNYIQNKEKEGVDLKYENEQLRPDYCFLVSKLKAIESSIIKELGKNNLRKIKALYEKEMTERLLRSTEH